MSQIKPEFHSDSEDAKLIDGQEQEQEHAYTYKGSNREMDR